jgi:hypothetical protein
MPKPYVPTKAIDLPTVRRHFHFYLSSHTHTVSLSGSIGADQEVIADHIMVEYSRTAVIAHISQATKGMQEGWGRPGK